MPREAICTTTSTTDDGSIRDKEIGPRGRLGHNNNQKSLLMTTVSISQDEARDNEQYNVNELESEEGSGFLRVAKIDVKPVKKEKTNPNTKAAELKSRRESWEQERECIDEEKAKIGYQNLSWEEFSKLPVYTNQTQREQSRFIEIQTKIKKLDEEKFFLWPEDAVVAEMNKRHAVVHIKQFHILTEKKDPVTESMDFCLESKQSLKDSYENQKVECSDGKWKTKAEIFLAHKNRRTYRNVVFDTKKGPDADGCFNLWSGFTKTPMKGNCEKFWSFVLDIICSKDEALYSYIRKWWAMVFQRPDELHTALVICGSQGVGKNTFVEAIGELFGKHFVQLSGMDELTSNFNDHLKYAVVAFANEATWGGNKKDIGTIKARVTDRHTLIESKGKDRIPIRNHMHLVLASNEEWPVHMDHDDRRFVTLNVSEEHKEDHEYFKTIHQELDNGGYEALLHDLLNEDLNGYNPRSLPNTNASFSIKMQSSGLVERYVYEALKAECFDVGNTSPSGIWHEELGKDIIFRDFRAWCFSGGDKPISKEQFIIRLKKILSHAKEVRITGPDGKRIRCFNFSTIDKPRKQFQKYYKQNDDGIWNE